MCSNLSFIDKEGKIMKPRGSFMFPMAPRLDSKLISSLSMKRGSIISKFNKADFVRGNLFVGMLKIHRYI